MYAGPITTEQKSNLRTYVGMAFAVLVASGTLYFFVLAQQEKKATRGFDPDRSIPSDTVLRSRLTSEEYNVVRENGSETPFQNDYWNTNRAGIYVDVIDGRPLFTSLDKYSSGLGIPAFSKPISYDLVIEKPDNSEGMQRIEVRSKRSDAHLGHLIGDPKSPTGRQYAIQSAALHFIPKEEMAARGYEKYLPLLEKK
ncbi:MAG TPA: peptide-methionine (R)-S-oxide reductase MsrB [Chthoniobacterales bacterium]|jgi:methionine-R-sulfoxide reductase|nr:peptide-methionine (R)-S-oxide reductase MsrB [Chthoniobacterales bacterium]